MDYAEFLKAKSLSTPPVGFDINHRQIKLDLFPFQEDIVKWALRRGRAAIFADCGMGKTAMQLEWAAQVVQKTKGRVLILAPLAVAQQTVREAAKFGLSTPIEYNRGTFDVGKGITVTNYEMMEHFDLSAFTGVVLDESSILKAYDGKMRNQIINAFKHTQYRLACTATPAPNDFMELGNHSEFLGVMNRPEMLSMFFVHDGGETQTWRLKGHAQDVFWKWVCSWAVMIRKPSDLGYSDDRFILPPLHMHHHEVEADQSQAVQAGMLFAMEARTLSERRSARRASLDARVAKAAELANSNAEQWLVWCDLNDEGHALEKAINGCIQVEGSDSHEDKENALLGFISGEHRVLVSKGAIYGLGVNLQNCHNTIFVGITDSWERYYQTIRRNWRFGQKHPVHCHIITSMLEGAVVKNIERKEADAARMSEAMVAHMRTEMSRVVRGTERDVVEYSPAVAMEIPKWL